MKPKFQVQLKIQKPVAEVFDAVVNPTKLSGYFVESASGPLVAGKTVKWKFPEFPEKFDVVCQEVVKNDRIVFEWPVDAHDGLPESLPRIRHQPPRRRRPLILSITRHIREGRTPETPLKGLEILAFLPAHADA